MSWGEIKKINSDMQEPLNYTNYIYDISVFGANSYVMDQNNHGIWDELALRSCYLYGHTGIHDYVYDRLTEENIDNLWNISGKLGRQLNNFHNNTAYVPGDAKEVLAGTTMNSYNSMIDKLRWGYQRYVNAALSAQSGVGAWILEVFGVDLSAYETAAAIINSADAWNLALLSEPLMVALTSSEYVMNLIATSDIAAERFADAIYYAGQNEKAVNVIANYDELVQQVVNDQTSMEWIAASENAIMVILQNESFTQNALQSIVAMTAFGNSETAVMLICAFFSDIQTSRDAITAINNNLSAISEQTPNIMNGNNITPSLTATKEAIAETVSLIDSSTSNAAMVNNMVESIISNSTFCEQMASNSNIMAAVTASSTAMAAIVASSTAMAAVVASSTAMSAVAKYINTESKIVFYTALNKSRELIQSAFTSLSDTDFFTVKYTGYQDGVASLNTYGTAAYAANSIIATATGYYSSNTAYTMVHINGTKISTDKLVNTSQPKSVTSANAGAISCPVSTWTEYNDGYAAISVFIAK